MRAKRLALSPIVAAACAMLMFASAGASVGAPTPSETTKCDATQKTKTTKDDCPKEDESGTDKPKPDADKAKEDADKAKPDEADADKGKKDKEKGKKKTKEEIEAEKKEAAAKAAAAAAAQKALDLANAALPKVTKAYKAAGKRKKAADARLTTPVVLGMETASRLGKRFDPVPTASSLLVPRRQCPTRLRSTGCAERLSRRQSSVAMSALSDGVE